jgi:site-specific DNA recombinase
VVEPDRADQHQKGRDNIVQERWLRQNQYSASERGNRMSPSHSRKGVTRHRYYVSSALIQGRPQAAGSVARIPAAKIEATIVDAVRGHIGPDAPRDDGELITTCVQRIEVRQTEIAISLASDDRDSEEETAKPPLLTVPWCKTSHRRHCDVLVPEGSSQAEVPPTRSDTRVKLVAAIARGRQWLFEIEVGTATIAGIATREACSKRHVHMTISLAFLAPGLVKAAVDSQMPPKRSVLPACLMRRSLGRVSVRCWASRTEEAALHRPA